MELTELKFAVDTRQLKDAVDLLGEVERGTAALGDAEGKRAPRRKKLTDEEIKAADAAKKLADETKRAASASEATNDKLSKLKDQLAFLRGELVQGETGFTKMQAGMMAAAKATGASEEILKQFAETFDNFNRITGQNPFDKSVGGLKFLESELGRLQKTTELATAGFKLTQQQIKLLSQDTEALTQVNIALGKSEADVGKIISEHTQQFAAKATQLNEQIERSKELERQTKNETLARIKAQDIENKARLDSQALWKKQVSEFAGGGEAYKETMNSMAEFYTRQNEELSKSNSANYWRQEFKNLHEGDAAYKQTMSSMADFYRQQEKEAKKTTGSTAVKTNRELAQSTKWLANEEAKMLSVLNSLNMSQSESNSLNEKASRSIANYERHLKQAGVTGKDAADKLALYREQQAQIQAIEQRNQGKFLSRALQPQIGDVAVSLAAGQNPLTVLLQQGDQIRGLIAQSGVEGAALQKIMQNAFSQTLTSIKDTAVAMSSVLGGAILSVGKSITGLVTGPFNAMKVALLESVAAGEAVGATFSTTVVAGFNAANTAALSFMRIPIVAAIAAIVALGVSSYQVAKQEDELTKALNLTGANLGLTKDTALEYARALGTTGISTVKATEAITEMAKSGKFIASDIQAVTSAAVAMKEATGVAIADTVKSFEKFKDEPVKALAELAQATGLISPAALAAAYDLQKTGDAAGASSMAIELASKAMKEQASNIEREFSVLGRTLIWFSKQYDDFVKTIKGSLYSESIRDQLSNQIKEEKELAEGAWSQLIKQGHLKKAAALENQLNIYNQLKESQDAANSASITAGKIQSDVSRLDEELRKREKAALKDKLTRQQWINQAIEEEAKLRHLAGGALDATEVSRISKMAGDEFDKTKAKSNESAATKKLNAYNAALNKYNDILNISVDYTASWNEEIKALDLLQKEYNDTQGKSGISLEQYKVAREKLFEQQPYAVKYNKEQADAQKLVNGLIDKGDDLTKNYTDTLAKLESLRGKFGIDPKDLDAAIEALKKTTPAAKALTAVEAEYAKTMDEVALSRKAVQDSYNTDFVVESLKKEAEALAKYKKSTAEAEIEYEKNIAGVKGKAGSDEYNQQVGMYRAMADEKKKLAQDVYDREMYLQSETFKLYTAGFDALKGLAKDFGTAVTDEFMNFATTGKSSFEALTSSFGHMVEKMIYDLIRLRIQKQVTGLFDQLINIGIQAMMPSFTPADISGTNSATGADILARKANGAAYLNGVEKYAMGGAFTNKVVDSPTLFNNSLMGEAGPEAIMPLKRDSSGSLGVVAQVSGSGSATSVVINNYGSDTATATESIDSRGNRSIEVTIGEVAAGSLNKSGSSSQKAMASTYGMKPQLIRR